MIEIFQRISYWLKVDRIGPDIPLTHLVLFFPKYARVFLKKKLRNFGKNSEIRPNVYIINCSLVSLGDNVILRPNTMLFASEEIEIQNNVLIGSGVHIYTSNHNYKRIDIPIFYQGHNKSKKVILKEGCWIGANSIILPGVIVGKNSVIGAGSIVTKNVPDYHVYAGNPAKKIKKIGL